MLDHRLRRWPNIEPTMVERLAIVGNPSRLPQTKLFGNSNPSGNRGHKHKVFWYYYAIWSSFSFFSHFAEMQDGYHFLNDNDID